ncbi:MAG: hypothetical protein HYU97_03020 [Deltaproteobacteria bacterium]|nr:hypothetical protein [Deltaproteobacteria bacterium]
MEKAIKVILNKLFEAKRRRRKDLAQLPIEEKIKILLKLQAMAVPILNKRGLHKKPWEI